MIGIIGAMEMEVEGIKAKMTGVTEKTLSSVTYYQGNLFGKEVVVAQCSVGKVNAAVCTQTMLLTYAPEFIVNPGVAGGIGENVHIGDLVVGSHCVQHDMDTTAFGEPMGNLLIDKAEVREIPCDPHLSALFLAEAKKVYGGGIYSGVIATGDQFIASSAKCDDLKKEFGALACEMESGSIAHVCALAHTPFVALRSISDNANESGKVDFLTFARESAQKTVELFNSVIPKL
ncbi:MAG: 5'-methylthioadenosine/adenosylhomocysteine nucleosidase [Oscillospiraceae bacterium]